MPQTKFNNSNVLYHRMSNIKYHQMEQIYITPYDTLQEVTRE